MTQSIAEILREYGPFSGIPEVHGVTYDGHNVWFAAENTLNALDPVSGNMLRSIDVTADAGTTFDGQHLYQLADDRIQKIDPKTGRVLATIPAPAGGCNSGLTWAEGTLWIGQYQDRKIHQVDPETGAILRTIDTNRFVTGVTLDRGRALPWHLGTRRERVEESRSPNGERFWRSSRCRSEWAFPGWSPMGAICSSVEGEVAAS
jgi:glutamine cyclotransferase